MFISLYNQILLMWINLGKCVKIHDRALRNLKSLRHIILPRAERERYRRMSLKKVFEPYFKIGTSVSFFDMKSDKAKEELVKHYSSMTAENEMKPMYMLDKEANLSNPEKYNLQPAMNCDAAGKYLEFAKENNIAMRGHTLAWHNQTPIWFFKEGYQDNPEAPWADRDTMLARMEWFIKSVLTFVQTEYPGVVYAWDVVNEAIEERNEEGWRKRSPWYQTIGEDFVLYAFRFARKYAAEGVKLFYNDYNTFIPFKRDTIIEYILKPLMKEKLIDGLGMQTHLVLNDCNLEEYERALHTFGALGLEIHSTELDIHNPDPSEEGQKKLADAYRDLFKIYVKAKKEGKADIACVTFWGMRDNESWLTGFRKERSYPLLFDDEWAEKDAYRAVIHVPEEV